MKDLGVAKKIHGMRISRNKQKVILQLSYEEVLERFGTSDAKPVSLPLVIHFKLTKGQCQMIIEQKDLMAKVSYVLAVGNLMYTMVCTRPYITHAVGVVSRCISNLGKQH